MKLTNIVMVIGGLFMLKKWSDGRHADILKSEIMPTDQYSSVSNIWEALNGQNMTVDGRHPNASPAYVDTTGNCCGLGKVGVM